MEYVGNTWIERFLYLADNISSWSKDKDTKTAAIIIDKDRNILSTGYNGQPRGCNDDDPKRKEIPLKYKYNEHAERNAIYAAAKNGVKIDDSIMILRWHPCSDCARAIIQSGISQLYCNKPDFDIPYWGNDFVASNEMLQESNVEVIYLEDLGLVEFKYER